MNRFISIREACNITSLSRTTIWKKVRSDPDFPKLADLGCNRKAFLAAEIEAWIEERLSERNCASPKTERRNG